MIDHYDLTLPGVAQQVSDVLAAGADDNPALSIQFEIQQDDTNPAFVGGDNTVTATSYGVRIAPIAAAEQLTEPRVFKGVKLRLREFWIIGTAGDVVHILVVRA